MCPMVHGVGVCVAGVAGAADSAWIGGGICIRGRVGLQFHVVAHDGHEVEGQESTVGKSLCHEPLFRDL